MTTLLYGSIIQIRSTESIYENKLFFVERLEEDELVLKSNDGNVLILPIEAGSLGESITEIVVLYKPIHNYSVQNKIFKGQWVEIIFEDQTVRGQILKSDTVIEVQLLSGEKVYIPVDRGMPKDVFVKKISRPHKEEVEQEVEEVNDSPDMNEAIGFIEEEEDTNVQYFYSIEQQTSDLLEHLMMYVKEEDNTPKLRNKMFKMIQRYKELRTKYTIFKNGIFLNKLPQDQLMAYAKELKTRMYLPVSKDISIRNYNPDSGEDMGGYFRRVESDDKEVHPSKMELNTYIDKINKASKFSEMDKAMVNVATNQDFKTNLKKRRNLTPATDQDVYLYEMPNILIPMTRNIREKDQTGQTRTVFIGDRKRYLTRVNQSFLLNSFMTPPTDYIAYSKVYDLRSSILDKINLNRNQYYSVFYNGRQQVVNKTKKDYAMINKYTFYDNHSDNFESYVSHIMPSFKNIIDEGIANDIINPFYNFNQFIREISVTNISELKNSEYMTASAYLKPYVKELLQKLKGSDRPAPLDYKFVNTTITNNMSIVYKELMPKELLNVYFSSSELFKIGEIDNYQYYRSNFIKDQPKLDVSDEEIKQIIEDIRARVKDPIEEKIAIVYKTEEERVQDRMLLKQVDKRNGIEYIFKALIQAGVDIRMDDLVSLVLRIIQSGYKQQKGDVATMVLRLMTQIKINEGDRAHVVESKKTYRWDKGWRDIETEPMCFIKKKLYKGDCGSLEKEKEYTDRIERLIFDIEQAKRRERELGALDLEVEADAVKARLVSMNSKKMKNELKYNEEKRIYDALERQKDVAGTMFSPYNKLRDKILSEQDLNFKYKAMQLFIQKYTKRGKDTNWFYCIETSVKLIPVFFSRLADAYLRTNNYDTTVDLICNEQGTLSDNGDKWVDKYSGYIIKDINFEEEYGLETVVAEKDKPIFDDLVVDELQLQREINQNLKSLMFYLGVYPDETDLYPLIIKTYNAVSAGAAKDSQLIQIRLLCIMSHILVHVQTHDMKFSTPYPNCKFSFEGYPLTDGSNLSGVKYIVCVILKLSRTPPWNVFGKSTEEKIMKNLLSVLEKFVVPMIEVEELLQKRRMVYQREVVLVSTDWKNFSPRLKKIKPIPYETRKLENIQDYLDRAYYFSYIMQSFIHKHVSEQEFILKDSQSTPYLVNTCCTMNNNVFKYFYKNAGLRDILIEIHNLKERIHPLRLLLSGTKTYFIENTRTPITEPTISFDEKTIYLKLASWAFTNPGIFSRFGLSVPMLNNNDSAEKKIEKLIQQHIHVPEETFITMLKSSAILINIPIEEEPYKLEDDVVQLLQNPKLNDYLFEKTNTMLEALERSDKVLVKVAMFNRTCRHEKTNPIISPQIEHYTHMNLILYNKINALLNIFPEMIRNGKASMSEIVRKHWLLADPHLADIRDSVNAYYNGILSLPNDEIFKRDIASIPLDRYRNLMKVKLANQETMNLLYHYIFVHIIIDYKVKNRNIDLYLKAVIKIFEKEDKVLNYDTKSVEYEIKLSKKSETQIKTDYFKNLSLEERRSENILKEHRLDKWGVGLQKSMFKYDKKTYARDKENAQEVINGLTAPPDELDETKSVIEEDGYDIQEKYEDDDDAEYEEED